MRRQTQGHGAHLLRFDREHHHLRALDRARVVGGGLDAVVPDQPLKLLRVRIGNHHPLSRQAAFGQAPDERGGHIAAADERKPTYVVNARSSWCIPPAIPCLIASRTTPYLFGAASRLRRSRTRNPRSSPSTVYRACDRSRSAL